VWVPAVLIAAIVLLPLVYLLLRTLGAGGDVWELLFRTRTLEILGRTISLVIAVTVVSLAISIPLAWLTIRTDLPFRRMWSIVTVLPLVMPSYVAGFVIITALGPRGLLQQLLAGPFGVERLPEIHGFFGATFAVTIVSYPFLLLTLQASMRGTDPSLEEASRSLGHGPWGTFRRVTLPQLRPALAAGSLLVAWAIFQQYQTSFDRMAAAALSLVLVALAVVILFTEFRTRGKSLYHRSTLGVARPPTRTRLRRWRWPALGFCSLVVLLTLIMPISVLGYWLVRGVSAGEPLNVIWSSAVNSGYVSVLAAIVTVIAALPVAILAVRYSGRISALLERATYIGYALPGIVIALALVFFGANYATPLYQTLALLILAYAILFLPQAIGSIRSSLMQVNPRMEEAARSLGRTPLQVLATITLPLVRPGILAGAALVFLTTMKELPATLILSPIGFKTLAISIWSATSEAFFVRAAVPALLLILISSVPLTFIILRQGRGQS